MSWKWIGAILVLFGCGGFGFSIAAGEKREVNTLRQVISALDLMQCELQYRLTPLPELCRLAGKDSVGCVREILIQLSRELESQIAPDVGSCMDAALAAVADIPQYTKEAFQMMGQSLGRFDVEGQLKGLQSVRDLCRSRMEKLLNNQEPRLRSYQTLGLCAGAALAILFI